MKAIVLESNNNLSYIEIPNPSLGSNEVLVRVAYCGICGSDIPRVFNNAARNYPLVLGHEFSGIVEVIGNAVSPKSISVGDHVVVAPLIPCHKCVDCKNGNYSLCSNYSFIGSRQQGAMAEYVAVPDSNIVKIPSNISFEQAATIEPATVALHALNLIGNVKNKTVAVLGCGIIGLYTIQLAKLLGAKKVVAIGRREKGLASAKANNADLCVSTLDDNLTKQNATDFDIVIECSGSDTTIHLSLQIIGKKGIVCFIGTPKSPLSFTIKEWEQINRKECSVIGSWMSYSQNFPGIEWNKIIEYMSNCSIECSNGIIDSIYDLKDAQKAFDNIKAQKTNGRVLLRIADL